MIKPELYEPRTAIVAGDSGSGKSFFLYHHPAIHEGKKVIILDMEDRWSEMIKFNKLAPLPETCSLITPNAIDADGGIDYSATYDNLVNAVKMVAKEKPDLVIFDGISDLRSLCHELWCIRNKRQHAVTPFDWGQINQMVRQVVFNLINLAVKNKGQLYMTTLLVETYDEQKTPEMQELKGLQLDLKRQIKARVDEVGILYMDGRERVYSRMLKLGAKSWQPDTEYVINVEKKEDA